MILKGGHCAFLFIGDSPFIDLPSLDTVDPFPSLLSRSLTRFCRLALTPARETCDLLLFWLRELEEPEVFCTGWSKRGEVTSLLACSEIFFMVKRRLLGSRVPEGNSHYITLKLLVVCPALPWLSVEIFRGERGDLVVDSGLSLSNSERYIIFIYCSTFY